MAGKPRLLVVASRGLAELVRAMLPEFSSLADVRLLDKPLDEAVEAAQELHRAGLIDVAIAAGMTGQRLRAELSLPTVLIKLGGYDIMQALVRARRLSDSVAIVTRQSLGDEFEELKPLLNLNVMVLNYRDDNEARLLFRELHERRIEVVIGSAQVAALAEQEGLTGVLIYSDNAVRQAFDDALEIARIASIEEAKRERIGNILYSLSEGVVAVDMRGRVQTLNPAMEKLLGVGADWALDQPLARVAPTLSLDAVIASGQAALEQVQSVNGRTLVINRLPIHEHGEQTGAVLTFQDASLIQSADRKLRSQSRRSQFVARYRFEDIMGESAAMRDAVGMARLYARSDATVLVTGESGTGKELFAQSIHNVSTRAKAPFVAINCASFPESLLESELFGYEEGAFTGGRKGGKPGLFESAHTGTIFLDEIGEMPLSLQTRLLRVLQEREVLRLGGTEPTPIDVRVIAATHQDLRFNVEQGLFRADLYYRINILNLRLPPLRERRDDILPIARVLARQALQRLASRRQAEPLIESVGGHLLASEWRGNVRELENLIERLAVFYDAYGQVDEPSLARVVPELVAAGAPAERKAAPPTEPTLAALALHDGDLGRTAQALGISRTTLWRRLKRLKPEAG